MDFKQWCHSVGIEDFRDVDLFAGEYLREAFEFQQTRIDKAIKALDGIIGITECLDCEQALKEIKGESL